MADPLEQVVKAMFSDIDVDDAQVVLKKLGLPLAYSVEAVDAVNAAANELADEAAKLKRAEAPRSERKAIKEQIDRFVNARAFLYRLRSAQPGDVSVAVPAMGGKN